MPETHPEDTQRSVSAAAGPCGLGRRLLIIAYDAFAVIALMMAMTAVSLLTPLADQAVLKDPIPTALLLLVWFFYLAWCWRHGGLTLGMRAWRARLVFEDGRAPGWGRCMLRWVLSLVSAAALGAGYLWALFNPERRTWHDLATGARLVRTAKDSHRSS